VREVRLTRRARDDLLSLPHELRDAVVETLDRLAVDAEALGKPLLGRVRGLWSARVGAYRVHYSLDDGAVIVRAIRHRAVAYGVRARRRRED
jgi:mRNA-degrading endonuclease RelE of RelBE toxin-antitoxin system